MIRIHKEGYGIFIFISAVLLTLVSAVIIFSHGNLLLIIPSVILSLSVIIFVARFFRVPVRETIFQDNLFYSPADGKVVVIEKTVENEYFKAERIQVSVFMSVWDVHINFFPYEGKVIHFKHHDGKYLVARHPKSSTLNERTTVVIEDKNNVRILLRQIAGIVARRIVCYAKPGMNFKAGDELGFIKFGSRVDIFFPLGTEILVNIGDKVSGKKTPLAKL